MIPQFQNVLKLVKQEQRLREQHAKLEGTALEAYPCTTAGEEVLKSSFDKLTRLYEEYLDLSTDQEGSHKTMPKSLAIHKAQPSYFGSYKYQGHMQSNNAKVSNRDEFEVGPLGAGWEDCTALQMVRGDAAPESDEALHSASYASLPGSGSFGTTECSISHG